MHYETTVEIAAPTDDVWEIVADVSRWPEWTESVRDVTWLEGTSVATGSRVRIKQPGMPALEWVVTEATPGASFTWRSTSPGVTTLGTHVLSSLPEERVAVTLGIRQTGPLAPLVGLLMSAKTRRYVGMEAAGLKGRAETTR